MFTSVLLLASLLTDASRQLASAEFAVEQLGSRPETAADADTYRKQLPGQIENIRAP